MPLNVLNHPTFAVFPNNAGGADFMGAPKHRHHDHCRLQHLGRRQQPAAVQHHRRAAQYNQIVANVNSCRRSTACCLPTSSPSPLPSNFYGQAANSFDIRTTQGYKLYQLRTSYGTSFGNLYNNSTPRFMQFGVKLYF